MWKFSAFDLSYIHFREYNIHPCFLIREAWIAVLVMAVCLVAFMKRVVSLYQLKLDQIAAVIQSQVHM